MKNICRFYQRVATYMTKTIQNISSEQYYTIFPRIFIFIFPSLFFFSKKFDFNPLDRSFYTGSRVYVKALNWRHQ